MTNLDYIIRDPRILMMLSDADKADFNFLLSVSGLDEFGLRLHLARLKRAGYVEAIRRFNASVRDTEYRLTEGGQKAVKDCLYWLKAIGSAHHCGSGTRYCRTDNHRRLIRTERPVGNRLQEVAQR